MNTTSLRTWCLSLLPPRAISPPGLVLNEAADITEKKCRSCKDRSQEQHYLNNHPGQKIHEVHLTLLSDHAGLPWIIYGRRA